MLVNKYFCYLSFVCFRYSTWARWGILTRISRSCRSWTTRTLSGCGPSFSSSTTRSPTVLHSGTSHHLFQHTVFQEVKNCCSISSCIYGLFRKTARCLLSSKMQALTNLSHLGKNTFKNKSYEEFHPITSRYLLLPLNNY